MTSRSSRRATASAASRTSRRSSGARWSTSSPACCPKVRCASSSPASCRRRRRHGSRRRRRCSRAAMRSARLRSSMPQAYALDPDDEAGLLARAEALLMLDRREQAATVLSELESRKRTANRAIRDERRLAALKARVALGAGANLDLETLATAAGKTRVDCAAKLRLCRCTGGQGRVRARAPGAAGDCLDRPAVSGRRRPPDDADDLRGAWERQRPCPSFPARARGRARIGSASWCWTRPADGAMIFCACAPERPPNPPEGSSHDGSRLQADRTHGYVSRRD